ncbi:hypothetical protein V1291_004791 [Nitrobacteraceae bacterium AZCC 1564]
MKRLSVILALSLFAAAPVIAPAMAQTACKAVSADGKPLSGAAAKSHMKKCCEDNAKSSEGKALSGAAKTSFVKKCMAG